MSPTAAEARAADRAATLREGAADASRVVVRLERLLARQQGRRKRLSKTIDKTRRRLLCASETANEAARAAAATNGGQSP